MIRDQLSRLTTDDLLDPSTYDWFKRCIRSLRPEVRAFLDVQIDGYYGLAAKRKAKRGAVSLQAWLNIATKQLAEEGKLRVEGEITAHYDEALEAALREGKSLGEAHEKALTGLGSAKKAGRAFCRVYLTVREEKLLKRLESPLSQKGRKRDLIISFTGLAVWLPLLFSMLAYTREQAVEFFISVFALISVAIFIQLKLVPYLFNAKVQKRALYWDLAKNVVVVTSFPIVFWPVFDWSLLTPVVFFFAIFLFCMGIQSYGCWLLIRKLGVSRSAR